MDECESKPEINQTVGDEYELGIECWNCGYKWIIFRHVAREDGSAKCPQCGMWNKRALQQALADTEIIEGYLNSPQFKKEYTTIKECKDFALSEYSRGIDDGWNKANQEFVVEGKATRPEVIELVGETKEHAEQYANREELVERIKEGYEPRGDLSAYKTACGIMDIILKHGLEE